MRISVVALSLVILCALPARAQQIDAPIAVGHSAVVWSDTLQEARRVFVHLPPRYSTSNHAYPVLIVLDAETQFIHSVGIVQFLATLNARMPEMIVIGVTNTNRGRDLTWSIDDTQHGYDMGGGGAFCEFLSQELTRWVQARYRTQPYFALFGHSLGGLFAVETLLNRPQTFDAYIAASPSLWWQQQATVLRAREELSQLKAAREKYLFLSWGDREATTRDATQALVASLSAKPPAGVRWASRYFAGDDHAATPHRTLYEGLENLFAGWKMPLFEPLDLAAVQAHYAALSKRYGFTINPPASVLGRLAQSLFEKGDSTAAMRLLRQALLDHPDDAGLQFRFGEGLERLQHREEALSAYRKAVRLAIETDAAYGDLAYYQAAVERLR